MGDAYECDACGDLRNGFPAVEVDIEGQARAAGGDIVLPDGQRVSWSRGDMWVELCSGCGVSVIEAVNAMFQGDADVE